MWLSKVLDIYFIAADALLVRLPLVRLADFIASELCQAKGQTTLDFLGYRRIYDLMSSIGDNLGV